MKKTQTKPFLCTNCGNTFHGLTTCPPRKVTPLAKTTLVAFREQWPWCKPYGLCLYGQSIVEIMSYPDENTFQSKPMPTIMIRATIGDPTTLQQVFVEDLGELCWPEERKTHYREGFIDGWAAAAAAARKGGR